jgi:competence protein ComFC
MILRAKASAHSPAWHGLYRRMLRQVLTTGICPQWISVPPPSWKRRWQGWHLAAELAQRLSKDLGCQYLPLLRRRQQRPAQAGLGAHARRRNLEGAFGLVQGQRNRLPPSLWIVDDVWTTGATYLECQRVLQQVGVHVHGAIMVAQVENLEGSAVDG